ncbi:dienelactone hydrolase family protein [Microbaculum sp. FT89]|uniref:dienelactone hydrolase family protein n=1 Tax=Microbaculum sp. FT89 TaxID=3447298 RepID=UPI003F5293B1
MGQMITLTAEDGFELGAYRADPAGRPRGGVVVVQEIFGVNTHIRAVCDRYAALGYAAVAPALFDRQQRGFESGYTPEEVETARKFLADIDVDAMLRDTKAAIGALSGAGKVGVVGYCLGGSIAFLAATRLNRIAAAVGYYGGRITAHADETPKVPTQLHYGETDQSIPMRDVETVIAKRPDCDIRVYPAGHGFSCDERASFDPGSTVIAWGRTLRWFDEHLAR